MHTKFVTMLSINLCCCCEKAFTHLNTWIIGKSSVKHHYLKKRDLYRHPSLEDISDADYRHAKIICKDFEIQNVGEYHNLYVQRSTLLLADVLNNFWKMYLEIYGLDPAHFLPVSRLARETTLKRTK